MPARWGGRHAEQLLTLLLSTAAPVCALCGRPIDARLRGTRSADRPSVEHRLPRSRGGTDAPDNLALAHFGCNAARGNRLPRRRPAVDARFFTMATAGSPAPASRSFPNAPIKREDDRE